MTTTIEEIKQQLNIALNEHKEAKEKLEKWEEGDNGGKWLEKLRRKLVMREYEDKEQKEEWEGGVKKLEEEKKRLEAEKKRWGDQVENLQNALVNYKEKGNGQIA
jgi:predicted  nucleic acid-binding Zn-ribbon protein